MQIQLPANHSNPSIPPHHHSAALSIESLEVLVPSLIVYNQLMQNKHFQYQIFIQPLIVTLNVTETYIPQRITTFSNLLFQISSMFFSAQGVRRASTPHSPPAFPDHLSMTASLLPPSLLKFMPFILISM